MTRQFRQRGGFPQEAALAAARIADDHSDRNLASDSPPADFSERCQLVTATDERAHVPKRTTKPRKLRLPGYDDPDQAGSPPSQTTKDGAFMEPRGRKRWQAVANPKDGKEGVDGSRPSEGFSFFRA
jgi:hypothetical protein